MTAAKEPTRGEMPFLDHLEELRMRIIWSLGALVLGCVAGFFLVTRFDVVGFLKQPIDPLLPHGQKLLFTSPIEPFMLTLKLAFVAGVLLASPVVVYHLWAFLRPALYSKERRVVLPVSLVGLILFTGGVAAGFYLVVPLALKVLFGFQSQSLEPFITADAYFSFTTAILLSFGAVFELPLVLLLLVYLRIISAAFLRRHRRIAIVINAVLSAILTPGDLVIMTVAVMLPVQLLYELSIVLAMILEKRRARADAADAAEAAAEEGRGGGEVPAPGRV
jgi:sec-independent protein translocase protein TatC